MRTLQTKDRRQTDGRQHSETFAKMLHGRFVHVGKTNRFANFGLRIAPKCVWRPSSAKTRWGSYGTPPDPVAVIKGRKEEKGLWIAREVGEGVRKRSHVTRIKMNQFVDYESDVSLPHVMAGKPLATIWYKEITLMSPYVHVVCLKQWKHQTVTVSSKFLSILFQSMARQGLNWTCQCKCCTYTYSDSASFWTSYTAFRPVG